MEEKLEERCFYYRQYIIQIEQELKMDHKPMGSRLYSDIGCPNCPGYHQTCYTFMSEKDAERGARICK